MKKIIIILCLILLCFIPAQAGIMNMVGSTSQTVATPTEILRAHFENSDTITSGSPAGYNSNADQTWALGNGAEYTTTNNVAPGSYVLHLISTVGTTKNATITTDVNKSAGTIELDLYSPSGNTEAFESICQFYVDAGNYIRLYVGSAVTSYVFAYRYAGTNSAAIITGITQDAWHHFKLRWDTVPHSGNYVHITVDTVDGTPSTDAITALTGTPTDLVLGVGLAYNPYEYYIDNVYLYDTWQD